MLWTNVLWLNSHPVDHTNGSTWFPTPLSSHSEQLQQNVQHYSIGEDDQYNLGPILSHPEQKKEKHLRNSPM